MDDKPKSLDELDPKLLETYKKLGIPLQEQARLNGIAVDAVFDSVSVATTFREELSKLGLSVFPTDANFVVVKIGEKCGEVCDTLKEKGILVRNRTRDPLLEGCIRITIGTKEQCDQVLRELKTILGK